MSAVSDVYVFALLAALIWGFEPVLSKRGLAGGGTALQASLVVVGVDSIVLGLALVALHGTSVFARMTPVTVGVFAFAGVVGTALGRLATFAGVHRVGASITSAGISTRPLFATVLALAWLQEPIDAPTAFGIVVLIAGLVVLAFARGGDLGGWRPVELLFPLAGAFAFAVGNVTRRFGLTTIDVTPIQAVTINELGALVALVAYAVAADRQDVTTAPPRTYLYFAVTGVLSAAALLGLFTALAHEDGFVAVVDPLTATAPLFTAVFAFFLLSDLERVTRGVLAGAILVVAGAALITAF